MNFSFLFVAITHFSQYEINIIILPIVYKKFRSLSIHEDLKFLETILGNIAKITVLRLIFVLLFSLTLGKLCGKLFEKRGKEGQI